MPRRNPAGRENGGCRPATASLWNNNRNTMNFIQSIQQTQITSPSNQPFAAFVPLHRRLFPVEQSPRDIARAAVREVLG
jgi:hypothetical protein